MYLVYVYIYAYLNKYIWAIVQYTALCKCVSNSALQGATKVSNAYAHK